jgi:hypothetical protein
MIAENGDQLAGPSVQSILDDRLKIPKRFI